MLNISGAFKKELVFEENRQYINRAVITLADETVLTVENDKIMTGGIDYDDAVGEDNTFSAVGSVIINSATLTLYNNDDLFSDYDFLNADVILYTGLYINNGTEEVPEMIRKGTYRVDDATYSNATITLKLLDYMEQFDRPYSESELGYPNDLESIVRDCCYVCGVTLNTYNFPHHDFRVTERPNSDSTTFRDVLSYVASIAGCFARCDVQGRLELKWFDTDAIENAQTDYDGGEFDDGTPSYETGTNLEGGSFNPWNNPSSIDSGSFTVDRNVHYITSLRSQNIAVDDIVITGVRILVDVPTDSEDDGVYFVGTDGYVIEISKNPFITLDNVNTILAWLQVQLIGLQFRPCNITCLDNPSIEAGDVGFIWDTHSKQHPILITRVTFSPGRPQKIVCGAETPSANSSTRYTSVVKSYMESRKQLIQQKSDYEQALEDLAERIENESSGLYMTAVQQQGGSVKYYYHNKPELSDSAIQILISDVGITVTPNGTDPNPTWYGLTVDGDLLARILSVHGINADWITTGKVSSANGKVYFDLDNDELVCSKVTNPKPWSSTTGTDPGDIVLEMKKVAGTGSRWYSYAEFYKVGYEPYGFRIGPPKSSSGELVMGSPSDIYIRTGQARELSDNYVGSIRVGTSGGFTGFNHTTTASGGGLYGISADNSGVMVSGNLSAGGISATTLSVSGSKNRVVKTKNYDNRLLYSYETPTPMFGDIGQGITDENGICIIDIDDIFDETIGNVEYQVFLQAEGEGTLYVDTKHYRYFIIKGTPNLKFAWELKAVQRDYELLRLEIKEEDADINAITFGFDTRLSDVITDIENLSNPYDDELQNLIKEQEELLYETA